MLKSSAGSSDLTTAMLLLSQAATLLLAMVQSITTTWHALAQKVLWLLALGVRAALTVATLRMLVSTVRK
jgi:hypothetical protein